MPPLDDLASIAGRLAAAADVGADLHRAIEHSIDVLFETYGCTHAYVDVGTNIGVQIKKLYQPALYAEAPVLPVFEQSFGSDRCTVCSIGFEPNPRHWPRLERVQRSLRAEKVARERLDLRCADICFP